MAELEGTISTLEEYRRLDVTSSPVPIFLGRVLNQHTIMPLEAYPSPSTGELDAAGVPFAMRYPGQRPETSFSLVSGQVNACLMSSEDGPHFYINTQAGDGSELVFDLNGFLQSKEAAAMEERIPVLAFGSNANPGQLARKFRKLEGADREIAPTMQATIKGVVPVYAAKIGMHGYVFADLYPTDESVESQVHVNFLSRAQLVAMSKTEAVYSLCKVPGVRLQTFEPQGYEIAAYAYIGREDSRGAGILTDETGRPIRVAETSSATSHAHEQFAVMSQAEVQTYIFNTAAPQIAEGLLLDQEPDDEIQLMKLILDRQTDDRLSRLRTYRMQYESDQSLTRVVGGRIQQAITQTGRAVQVSGLRERITPDDRDITADAAQSFSELHSMHVSGTLRKPTGIK